MMNIRNRVVFSFGNLISHDWHEDKPSETHLVRANGKEGYLFFANHELTWIFVNCKDTVLSICVHI